MEFDLDQIVKGHRSTAAYYHIHTARGWRIIGEEKLLHSPLSYSAFEFRSAIERVLVELLLLVKQRNITRKDLDEIQRFSGLKNLLLRSGGGQKVLYRALLFNRILSKTIGIPNDKCPSIPDIDKLSKFWGQLSEYCHRQLMPHVTWDSLGQQWIRDGYALLNKVETYLWEITITSPLGWFRPQTLPPDFLPTRTQFINGDINEQSLTTRILLMEPAVHMRAQKRLFPSRSPA